MRKILTILLTLLISSASYAQTTTVERVIDGDFITREEAISIAEQFVIDNGYTDKTGTIAQEQIVRESLERSDDIIKILASRRGELQSNAFGAKSCKNGSWLVVFLRANGNSGRGVTMDSKGANIRMAHQDVKLDQFIIEDKKVKIFTVEKVIDGSTLKLTSGETVRLIGVDVPKIVFPKGVDRTMFDPSTTSVEQAQRWNIDLNTLDKMGKEAAEFLSNILDLLNAKEVRLEYDVKQKDEYGRLLAYVYATNNSGAMLSVPYYVHEVMIEGKAHYFLNATLIGAGYARPAAVASNSKHADLFKKLYEEAKEQKRGLWK